MIRIALTNLRAASGRLVAAGIAVTVSVAFIVSAFLFSTAFGDTLGNQIRQQWAGADVAVLEADREAAAMPATEEAAPLTEEVAGTAAAVPGAEEAVLERSGYLRVTGSGSEVSGIVTNLPTGLEERLTAGHLPEAADELTLPAGDAEVLGVGVGDTLDLADPAAGPAAGPDRTDGQGSEYTVTGLLEGSSPFSSTLYLTEEGLDAAPAEVYATAVRIAAAEGTDPAALAADVQAALEAAGTGEGLTTLTVEQHVEAQIDEMSGQTGMLATIGLGFGLLSAGVAALVISNTFQVLVASRARVLALYRAVGASRAQLRGATLLEGAALGLAGSAAGVGVGLLIGWGLTSLARALWMPEFAGIAPGPAALLVGPAVGVLVTTAAALAPARRATRVSPVEALRPADVRPAQSRFPWARAVLGAVLGAGGVALCLVGALGHSVPVGIIGCFVLFLALLIAARAVVPPLIGVLARGLGVLTGSSKAVLLAGRSAREAGGRTSSTTAALLIGVTLVSAVVVGSASVQRSVELETSAESPVDLVIDGAGPEVEALLGESPVVEAAETVPAARADISLDSSVEGDPDGLLTGEVSVLTAAEATAPGTAGSPLRSEGYEVEPGTLLLSQQEVGGEGPTADYEGAPVTVTVGDASVELRLDASLAAPAGTALLSAEDARALGIGEAGSGRTPAGGGQTWVRTADDATMPQIEMLATQLSTAGFTVDPYAAADRAQYAQAFQVALAVVLGLLAAAVVIAVIGVSNTLTLAVIDRRREGALLRALGFSRGSLARMITVESLLMAVVALVVGLSLGVFYGWVGNAALLGDAASPVLAVAPGQLALIAGATVLAAVLASAVPARAMSRIAPAEGLSEE
ncbi:FtsX-like permease family protein [Brevibacterium album]|uniref:FtsX-like permease family protein n=1 Tax=Brevibacterium album TaxID=417948 RepID=UPI0003F75796|nr:FtsX family ABC transporter permease [Brevibacterium album]